VAREDLLAFLGAIDSELMQHARAGETLDLYLLGRSALILGYGAPLMTKDVDVVDDFRSRLLIIAVGAFGKDHSRVPARRFYLETVSSGLPPLPAGYRGRCVDVPGRWQIIRPKRLEAHDLIVTKLRRFHQGDREDIRILCDTGDVEASILRERFDSAYLFSDRDDPKVVRASEHLQAVSDYLNGMSKII
jgi:hypothetical protein